jgi:membrane protein DedA with SNARE-associated domain
MAWATLLGLLGFTLSNRAAWLIREVKSVELAAAGVLVLTVIVFVVLRRSVSRAVS